MSEPHLSSGQFPSSTAAMEVTAVRAKGESHRTRLPSEGRDRELCAAAKLAFEKLVDLHHGQTRSLVANAQGVRVCNCSRNSCSSFASSGLTKRKSKPASAACRRSSS